MIEDIFDIYKLQHKKNKHIDHIYRYPTKQSVNRTVPMTLQERGEKIRQINQSYDQLMSEQYDVINEKRISEGKKPLKNPYKKKGK